MLNGRFEIEHEIGAGAMGTVFKGLDVQSGWPVAIKRLKSELITPSMLERFRREGEALHQLNHPNIVKFVETFEDEGKHYLVLEYIDGANLEDILQQNTLDLLRTIDISLGIADALTRAHHLNIIHRDIKPANILIGEDGGVYLTDFGVAAFGEMSHLTETHGVIGTIPYLSPEILEGKSISEKSDIWAFGIVLYEMLIGERPFQGDHVGTMTRAILFDDVPDLEAITDGVPIAMIDLIYRMLEKDPMFRIPSVRLVGVELEALKKGYVPYTPRQLKRDEPTEFIESRFSTPTPSHHILNNLPSALTPFVGREAELKEIERLLSTERLVSIVAPGGMGKTRLALEAANGQLGQWADGVYFVDLAPISAPDAIPGKIAEATGFQFYEGVEPRDQILSFLREKQMLLVMDNYEHLLDGVDMVSDVLQTAPNVSIIATSRERLHLQGETLFTITGMEFPDWETPEDALDYAAVKLFMQSARRTNPAFELREEDLKYISRICRLVNGMPLGILLAASWTNILTPEEIAAEIEQSLDFLETDQHDVPDRQRSIRAVFDHSWNRMSRREQDIFAAMSVFRGGFTREAAQAVTGAGLRDLMMLVSQSMITRQPDGRYSIHELMRQYAAEILGQNLELEKEARVNHCQYYIRFMAEREQMLKTSSQLAALREIDPEIENVSNAWRYGVDSRLDDDLRSALRPLKHYCEARVFDDLHVALMTYAVEKAEGLFLGRTLIQLAMASHDTERNISYARQALAIIDHPDTPLDDLITVLSQSGKRLNDVTLLDRAFELAIVSGDPWHKYMVIAAQHRYERNNSNHIRAAELGYEVIHLLEEMDIPMQLAGAYVSTGNAEGSRGNDDMAIRLYRQCIEMARELDLHTHLYTSLNNLAPILAKKDQFDEAIATIEEAIGIARRLGRAWDKYVTLDTHARLLYNVSRYEEARHLFNECYTIVFSDYPDNLQAKAFITNRLGFVEFRMGNRRMAGQHFVNALAYLSEASIAYYQNRLNSLVGLAFVMEAEGKNLGALHILYVINRSPIIEGNDSYIDEARDLTAKLEAELSPEEIEIARQQAETYDLEALIEELLAEYGAGN